MARSAASPEGGEGALRSTVSAAQWAAHGARALAEAGAADAGLFVVTGGRVVEEAVWPPASAWAPAKLAETRAAAEAAALGPTSARRRGRREAVSALRLRAGGHVVAVAVLAHATTSRNGTRPRVTDAVRRVARLVAHGVAAHEDAARARAATARFERWFKMQDHHIRVLDGERQKFAAVVNQSDTIAFVTDGAGRVLWTNKALGEHLRADDGSGWIGRTCDAVCNALAGAGGCGLCPVSRAHADRTVAHRELRRQGSAGVRAFYLTALPIRSPDGRVGEVLVLIQDLTDLNLLRESEARKSAMLEGALDAIVTIDGAGQVLEFNAAAERLFGYRASEAVGRLMADLIIPPAARDPHTQGLAHYLTTGRTNVIGRRVRVTAMRADGSQFPIELTVTALPSSGEPAFTGFIRDLTEQKRAEEALQQSEERLRTVVANAPIVLFALDADGIFTLSEGEGLGRLGLAAGEVVGRSVFDVYAGAPDVLDAAHRALAGDSFTTTVAVGGLVFQTRYTPLRAPDGRSAGAIGVAVDVTEPRRLEEQLRQAQKMEAVGQLAGGVAHDFNNLLTVIMGHGELLATRLPAEEPLRDHALEIHKAGRRGAWLARQLLAFSRRDLPTPQVFDLNDPASDMERMLRRLIGEDIELTRRASDVPALVRADRGQIEQVILNLVVNARDAMPGGGRLIVEVAVEEIDQPRAAAARLAVPPGAYVRLTVADSGCGMDPETLAHAFEPFFTTKERGRGTGLGLCIVYGIVQGSGGETVIASEPGRGTRVSAYLPRAAAETETHATDGAAAGPLPRGAETILLVEDEDGVRALALEILREYGYEVLAAVSAEEALAIARSHSSPIHLLLTDVVMPRMGGGELARHMTDLRPTTRALFMSGYTDDEVVRHGVLAAGAAFLSKPFTIEGLVRAVRSVLDARADVATERRAA